MEIIKKIWNWLVVSSANPQKISLTVKGVIISLIPILLTLSGIAHLSITSDGITNIASLIANLIDVSFTIIASISIVYGIIRKIITGLEELLKKTN